MSPHALPFAYRKRQQNIKWLGSSNETGKPEAPCHGSCDRKKKIPPFPQGVKFCCPSLVMETSEYEQNIVLRRKQQTNTLSFKGE